MSRREVGQPAGSAIGTMLALPVGGLKAAVREQALGAGAFLAHRPLDGLERLERLV